MPQATVRNYIGLATTPHDPALAIVNARGEVVFAEACERYLQNKRAWNAIPDDLVRIKKLIEEHCEAGAELVVATSWRKGNLWSEWGFEKLFLPACRRWVPPQTHQFLKAIGCGLFVSNKISGNNVSWQNSFRSRFHDVSRRTYDHHLTHAATACHSSPFSNAVCAVIDGYGERFRSTCFYRYEHGRLSRIEEIKASRFVSLGMFYSFLCRACGFDPIQGEQWKVMGLASYGKLDGNIYRVLKSIINVDRGRLISPRNVRQLIARMEPLIRDPKAPPLQAADLAFTGQLVFTEIMVELLSHLHSLDISDNLVLSGGCALNSACNGLLLEKTPFKNLFVFAAPGDDGNAIGAALCAYHEDHPSQKPKETIQSPYLGTAMSLTTLNKIMKFGKLRDCRDPERAVCEQVAHSLAEGKIVGWVQGRAEFGPRALGNRSILADPRSKDIKEVLNDRVKFREEFRPFAPAILHEHGPAYFENYQESPYMERALRFRPDAIHKVPGVVHVDGTGRLQTVKREWNAPFYDLIAAFYRITGVPILLNTSFNVMGKPIIHSAEDALAVFFTSGLDLLVIGDLLLDKGRLLGVPDPHP